MPVDLARPLDAYHEPCEGRVIPDAMHGVLSHTSWARADEVTAAYPAQEPE